jgi:HAT (Half-A-TPR) repeat
VPAATAFAYAAVTSRTPADARAAFEKWMQWEPDHHGWMAYIKFELRGSEVRRARSVYERYVACHPSVKAWVRFAKFEAEHGDLGRSRRVYERALQVRPHPRQHSPADHQQDRNALLPLSCLVCAQQQLCGRPSRTAALLWMSPPQQTQRRALSPAHVYGRSGLSCAPLRAGARGRGRHGGPLHPLCGV